MTKVLRQCNKDNCNLESEVGYHRYKNDTFHVAMICPVHGYTCLPYEELNIRDFKEIRKEYYIAKSKEYKENKQIKKANKIQKKLNKLKSFSHSRAAKRKGLPASELLSL